MEQWDSPFWVCAVAHPAWGALPVSLGHFLLLLRVSTLPGHRWVRKSPTRISQSMFAAAYAAAEPVTQA